MMQKINHLAVLVAGVAFYIWSAVWYAIFSNQWSAYTGKSVAGFQPAAYALSFVMAIAVAYVTAIALHDSENPNMVRHGMEFGVFFGVGIWATNLLSLTLYEGRPIGLWLIDTFNVVIGMAIMGAIIGAWRKRA